VVVRNGTWGPRGAPPGGVAPNSPTCPAEELRRAAVGAERNRTGPAQLIPFRSLVAAHAHGVRARKVRG